MITINSMRNWIEKTLPWFILDSLKGLVDLREGLNIARINKVKKLIEGKPLILAIETVSICNALCVFCAYPTMKRKKEVMTMEVFEKIVREYSQMGGGALSLTPVMGDPLLDPQFIERYKILEQYNNIEQVSFTTNGIAFKKFTNDELKFILERTFLIQFSIGGLDRETYKNLYRVDRLEDVLSSVARVISLRKETVHRPE